MELRNRHEGSRRRQFTAALARVLGLPLSAWPLRRNPTRRERIGDGVIGLRGGAFQLKRPASRVNRARTGRLWPDHLGIGVRKNGVGPGPTNRGKPPPIHMTIRIAPWGFLPPQRAVALTASKK
jgi:hypothetical protein